MTSKTVRSFGFLSVCPARCDQVADRGNSPVRCNPAPRQFVVFSSRPGLKGFSRHKKRGDIRCAHPIEKSPHFSIVSRPISTFSLCASRVVRPCQEKKAMARCWRICPIVLILTSFLLIVHAHRHHHESLHQLIKDQEQIQVAEAMLRNYQGKFYLPLYRHL